MLKRVISFGITIVMVVCLCCFSASATTSDQSGAKYTYTYSCSSNITAASTSCTGRSMAQGYNGETTKIVITQTLQKKNSTGAWTNLSTNSETYYSYKAVYSKKYNALYQGVYRIKSVFTVYAGSNSETITKYSSQVSI